MENVKKVFRCISLLLLFIGIGTVWAHADTVRGTVVDDTGEPLIGVTVLLKGSNQGASTDIDGQYSINVPNLKTAVLDFSYVGMVAQSIKVNGRNVVDVTLVPDNEMLDEVVVVGYGQQKKASIVGAITQASGETLERAGGVSSVGAALTGNLPGVVTTSSTGMPGDEDPQIVIRSASSWNSSSPLILVDGIERPMSSVDISSVKTISVLKDASATAVYGVKGANGVILITTKRGEEGRAKISIGMNVTAKVVSKLPETLGSADAMLIRNRAIERELGIDPDTWASIYPDALIDKYRNPGDEWERYVDVDWQKELFKDYAMSYNPNINVAGGTKNVKYFAAVDFLHEGDLFRTWDNGRGYKSGYGYNRVNVRSNLDFQITPTTVFKVNLFGMNGEKKRPWNMNDSDWGTSQLWQAAYSAPHDTFLPRYSDGTWGYYPLDTQGSPNSVTNLALAGAEKVTTTRINTDFTIEQDLSFITKGLRASALVSWDNVFVETGRGINDLYNAYQQKWINPITGEVTYSQVGDNKTGFDFNEGIKWNTAGGEVDNNKTVRNLFYQGQLYWARKFDAHDVSLMGVFNRTENTYGSDFTNYREDWAFRVTYNFADRYFLEYNGAYNGSERFSSKHRFAFFNSGAVGWMITQEKFMNFSRGWLDMLKVRYSYGEVGDDYVPARWLYATQMGYGGQSFQGINQKTESPYIWFYEKAVGNLDVHWEKAIKQNLGIDYSFFNHLAAGSLEFFREKRSDILISGNKRAVPSYYGTTAPTANLGRVRTSGFELELRLNYTFGRDFHLWGNFNMTHATNKILSYDDPELTPDYQKNTGFAIGQDHATYTAGFANNWDEVIGMTQHNTNDNHKLPGQYISVDYNGDGVIDSNDSAPYGYTGTPQNTYNATIGFEWKGFSAFVQFYGVTNVNRYVGFKSLNNHLNNVFDEGSYWSGINQDADSPFPRWNTTPSYYEGTRYHYDGSYIRLKNAEIAYTWHGGWVKKLGMSMFKLYLNGNNLWMWSRMPDDRESNFAGTGLASQGAYPTVRRFNLGFKFDI
ncbi:MAG: TonB-dependent receptor [Staphylococcus sp.]|nr:TonB-dependent receptor [Staphylococcus sp.]